MPSWEITTLEYDVPLGRLLERRLREVGVSAAPEPAGDGVRVRLAGKDALQKLSKAVKKVLLRDLQYLVLARMADAMPLSLAEKRTVLTDALYNARMREDGAGLEYALEWFLREERRLCLDGFLHFRMQDTLMLWQLCTEQAAGKVLVQKEYGELMRTLREYVRSQRIRMGELRLRIRADGSCTLMDDDRLMIEYADSSPDGIVTLLVNMAPQRIVIYDESGGMQKRLCEMLQQVFSGRIEVRKERL